MKWNIAYNSYSPDTGKRKSWHCFSEVIEAQGIMHASKLAQKHADELTNILKDSLVRVADISQIIKQDE